MAENKTTDQEFSAPSFLRGLAEHLPDLNQTRLALVSAADRIEQQTERNSKFSDFLLIAYRTLNAPNMAEHIRIDQAKNALVRAMECNEDDMFSEDIQYEKTQLEQRAEKAEAEVARLKEALNSQRAKVVYFDEYNKVLREIDAMVDLDCDLFDENSGFSDAESTQEANRLFCELKMWMDEARLVLTPPQPVQGASDENRD